MDRSVTTRAANADSENNEKQGNSTNITAQRERVLNRLQSSPLSTLQARQELGILHQEGCVIELREQGYNIITHWTEDSIGNAKHRVACYVLLGGAQ